jgi:hypothetical protein
LGSVLGQDWRYIDDAAGWGCPKGFFDFLVSGVVCCSHVQLGFAHAIGDSGRSFSSCIQCRVQGVVDLVLRLIVGVGGLGASPVGPLRIEDLVGVGLGRRGGVGMPLGPSLHASGGVFE